MRTAGPSQHLTCSVKSFAALIAIAEEQSRTVEGGGARTAPLILEPHAERRWEATGPELRTGRG